jgi:hypothetical protein
VPAAFLFLPQLPALTAAETLSGRIVGKVVLKGYDMDLAMVEASYAWWYRKYAGEQSAEEHFLYEAAEDDEDPIGLMVYGQISLLAEEVSIGQASGCRQWRPIGTITFRSSRPISQDHLRENWGISV